MQEFFANFAKRGAAGAAKVMRIDVESRTGPDTTRERYLLLDQFAKVSRP